MCLARAYRILDYPDNDRRLHDAPIPRIGGTAIFVATIFGDRRGIHLGPGSRTFLSPLGEHAAGVALGALIVFGTGIVDDLRGVAPTLKIVAQLIMVRYARSASISLTTQSRCH